MIRRLMVVMFASQEADNNGRYSYAEKGGEGEREETGAQGRRLPLFVQWLAKEERAGVGG